MEKIKIGLRIICMNTILMLMNALTNFQKDLVWLAKKISGQSPKQD